MKFLSVIISTILVLATVSSSAASKSTTKPAGALIEPGRFSVPAPVAGFHWQKVRDLDEGKTKGALFVARREGLGAQVVLAVQYDRAIASDEARIEEAKAGHRGWSAGFRETNHYTDVKSDPPQSTKPVPDLVRFHGTALDPDKDKVFFEVVTFFGKQNTYQF